MAKPKQKRAILAEPDVNLIRDALMTYAHNLARDAKDALSRSDIPKSVHLTLHANRARKLREVIKLD